MVWIHPGRLGLKAREAERLLPILGRQLAAPARARNKFKRVFDPWPRVFTGAIQMKTYVRVSITIDVAKCLRAVVWLVVLCVML